MPTAAWIKQVGVAALKKAGVSDAFAEVQMSMLLEAELRGVQSHGILRLPRIIQRIHGGLCNPRTVGVGRWEHTALYRVDGQGGLGPVVALDALDALCQRVDDTGVAAAAIQGCEHLGMLGWYAEQAARRGYVLIGTTVSEALMHPWGGSEALIGTNPITIGVPAQPDPFVLDMATSLVSMGKIHDYANRGLPIPHGWAVDAQGNATTDAQAAKSGAIAPFGGAKGYGLGLGLEVFIVALTGCAVGKEVVGTLDAAYPCNKGDVFIVARPVAGIAATVSSYLNTIRASHPVDGATPVRVPGDRGRRLRTANEREQVAVDSDVWQQICRLAGDLASPAVGDGTVNSATGRDWDADQAVQPTTDCAGGRL